MADRYPNKPGSKGGGASKDAAEKITSRAEVLRTNIAVMMQKGYRLTADEIAARMKESVLAIRPRISELVKTNISGMTAHVLRHWSSEKAVELPPDVPKKRPAAPTVHRDQNAFF
jgi:predicted XRE-type DNA-binding protein